MSLLTSFLPCWVRGDPGFPLQGSAVVTARHGDLVLQEGRPQPLLCSTSLLASSLGADEETGHGALR